MNKQQREYAMNRINEIARKKVESWSEKNKEPERGALTWAEMKAQIASGEAKLHRSCGPGWGIKDGFIYTQDKSAAKKREAWEKAKDDYSKSVYKDATSIKDKLMLGNADEALKMIEKFDN